MRAGKTLERILVLVGAALAGCGTAGFETPQAGSGARTSTAAEQDPADPAVRIRFYEAQLRKNQKLFADHAELGAAYLDMARETYDVAWLGKARAELERSLEIQPSSNAFATLASLCNFSHRFACALENAERAARFDPRDGRARSLRVEAHLGLGELKKAAVLLDQPRIEAGAAFVLPAARGRWLAEQKRHDEALQAFTTAAEQARSAGVDDVALRAELDAAGAMIDSGRPGLARPHLETATRLLPASWPMQALLQVRWAEVHDLEQRPEEALRAYESILERQKDPEIYRRAYTMARKAGRTGRADELFAAAEAEAERILAAGEIFALESHARLYADAGVKLERAEKLARENLEHKRDRRAYDTLAYVRKQRAAAR